MKKLVTASELITWSRNTLTNYSKRRILSPPTKKSWKRIASWSTLCLLRIWVLWSSPSRLSHLRLVTPSVTPSHSIWCSPLKSVLLVNCLGMSLNKTKFSIILLILFLQLPSPWDRSRYVRQLQALVGVQRRQIALRCRSNWSRLQKRNCTSFWLVACQVRALISAIITIYGECSSSNTYWHHDTFREFTLAEIEHFVLPDQKDHPKFSSVADTVIRFFPRDLQLENKEPVPGTIGDMVAKGVVNNETLGYFIARVHLFLIKIGITPERLRFRQHLATEMAHYACDCWDAEIETSYVSPHSSLDLTRVTFDWHVCVRVGLNASVLLTDPLTIWLCTLSTLVSLSSLSSSSLMVP